MTTSELIVPFVESVESFCTTMVGCDRVERQKVVVAELANGTDELTGLIGLSGPDRGTVALALPAQTALALASALMGMEFEELEEDVTDCVAEMTNIVAGGAKVKLPQASEEPFELGLPTVVKGRDYVITSAPDRVWLEIPFETDLGPFSIRVSFESMKRKA